MLTVRAARPEDAAAIAFVHVRSWQVAYRGLMPDHYLDGLRPEDRADRYNFAAQEGPHPRAVVAEDDGVLTGFCMKGPARHDPRVGELYAIYVDPDRWSQGTGRCLMAESRRSLYEQGFTEAVLWVLEGNERAQQFYRADGWAADGAQKTDEIWGVTVHEVRFGRPLP